METEDGSALGVNGWKISQLPAAHTRMHSAILLGSPFISAGVFAMARDGERFLFQNVMFDHVRACVRVCRQLGAVTVLAYKLLQLQRVGTRHRCCRRKSQAEAWGTALSPEAPAP